jgi:hypothetical protein
MVANNNVNNAAAGDMGIMPIANPFLEQGAIDHFDQLFQMELIRPGGQKGSDNNLFLFGYNDTDNQDIAICIGRQADDQHWGICPPATTLRQLLAHVLLNFPGYTFNFLEARWAGPGAADALAFPELDNLFEMLELRLSALVQQEAAADFEAQLIAPEPPAIQIN